MLTVNAAISGQSELFLDEYAFIWLNTDGDRATGDALFGGVGQGCASSAAPGPTTSRSAATAPPRRLSFTWTTHPSLSAVAMAGIKASIDTLGG